MTSAQLADLNGLLAMLTADAQRDGDRREKPIIADEILGRIGAPDLRPAIENAGLIATARLRAK